MLHWNTRYAVRIRATICLLRSVHFEPPSRAAFRDLELTISTIQRQLAGGRLGSVCPSAQRSQFSGGAFRDMDPAPDILTGANPTPLRRGPRITLPGADRRQQSRFATRPSLISPLDSQA